MEWYRRLWNNCKEQPLKCLNVGCGDRFHSSWVNIDFFSSNPSVLQHDLRQGIPMETESFDIVYHSHVLEHFTPEQAEFFMQECRRVLRVGGILRVAVPDLEQICRLYLRALENVEDGCQEWEKRYEWMTLELLDQCVRTRSGGKMLEYLLEEPLPEERFVAKRLGGYFDVLQRNLPAWRSNQSENSRGPLMEDATAIGQFRQAGEVHQWMYDRHSLRQLLERHGFVKIKRQEAAQSYLASWNEFQIDTDAEGRAYKADSLYMEGIRT